MNNDRPVEVQQFLSHYPEEARELALLTRGLILDVMPGLIEQLDPSANLIGYGTDTRYKGLLCGIIIYPAYVNLMLAHGASLPDPLGLLVGTGKKARHIKIRQAPDLENPGLRALLEEAARAAAPDHG